MYFREELQKLKHLTQKNLEIKLHEKLQNL